ncbi:MAG: hypothetical protein Kow0077_09080 [Anaerolineae bacterium]
MPDQQPDLESKPVEDAGLPPVAERVLVPIANPATAEGLLRLALSLVDDGGVVIAAYVSVHGSEPRPAAREQLEAIIERLREEGAEITLVTDLATSIARGILDIAQEHNADLIVLGVRGQQRGRVVLGPVVEAVARTAPCNVLVYRGMKPLYGGEGYRKVIVPVDGSDNSRLAMRIGLRFAHYARVPLNALYVQTNTRMRRWQALGMIEASLEGLDTGPVPIRKVIEHASDVVSGLIRRGTESDLIVLGFSTQSSLDSWVFGDIPQRMLSRAKGPLILVKQNVSEDVSGQVRQTVANLMPTLTPSEEQELVQVALEMSRPTIDFLVLVVLSCLIAALGLLQNSAAVIIGAMLIAPLMSPLVGFAVGLTRGDWYLMRRAALTLLRGVVLTLVLSALIGVLAPVKNASPEMLARGQPSLPDLGIALFSGMAGAYAMARKDIPSALAGVAIAAALMPPLCTVGIALAFARPVLASGALFLFVTNIIAITLGAGIVFLWLGVRLRSGVDDPMSLRQRLVVSLAVLLVLAVPLGASLQASSQAARQLEQVWAILERDLGADVLNVEWQDGDRKSVVATVRLPEVPESDQVQHLQEEIQGAVDSEITLQLVVMQVVQSPRP